MNFGFNSNVHARDTVYHVQTEDRGPSHPYLDTVVYESGRVVYKRSTSYENFAASLSMNPDFGGQLHERLAEQHREVIAELEAGTLEFAGNAKLHARTEAEDAQNESLDVRLLNPKTWLVSGSPVLNVILEIELRRRNSEQVVADADVEALLERERERINCLSARTDGAGKVTLKFPMPSAATDGCSLVIRATDGGAYGELRFRLKSKQQPPPPPDGVRF